MDSSCSIQCNVSSPRFRVSIQQEREGPNCWANYYYSLITNINEPLTNPTSRLTSDNETTQFSENTQSDENEQEKSKNDSFDKFYMSLITALTLFLTFLRYKLSFEKTKEYIVEGNAKTRENSENCDGILTSKEFSKTSKGTEKSFDGYDFRNRPNKELSDRNYYKTRYDSRVALNDVDIS